MRYYLCSLIGQFNIIKMLVFFKFTYKFNMIDLYRDPGLALKETCITN